MQEDCDGRKLIDVLISIADNYIKGTNNGIRFDEESGLIFSPSHFTWMDTNYPAGTPRQGYPVEIQALWYAAISLLAKHNVEQSQRWNSLSEKISTSIVGLFHNGGGLSDCLHCDAGTPAKNAIADDHCRCNQLFAVTLGAIKDKAIAKSIINDCAKLIVPGAIRTLADRPVSFALPIYSASGELLNNPSYPYQGWYSGDEDNKRKPAYHNGTAWGWVYPSYCEAIQMVYGNAGNEAAKSIISSSLDLMKSGCLGHIPEIMDANIPHIQRGCRAQAWSVTELYRVAKYLGIK